MELWRLWKRSRLLAIVVTILVLFTIANAIWVTLRSMSPAKAFVDAMAAGVVIGIMIAARVLQDNHTE